MQSDARARATRILARLWLEEPGLADLPALRAMPALAEGLPQSGGDAGETSDPDDTIAIRPGDDAELIEDLAVEYQRLFGFNLPPYESVFLDPTGMLQSAATRRVHDCYRDLGFAVPGDARVAAEDHVGLELLALAERLDRGDEVAAQRLTAGHLALWLPPLIEALCRLSPHPFYRDLSALTLGMVLGSLPPSTEALDPAEVLPDLPEMARPAPPHQAEVDPTSRAVVEAAWRDAAQVPLSRRVSEAGAASDSADGADSESAGQDDSGAEMGLKRLVRLLATPRKAGCYLSRADLVALAKAAELPGLAGDRKRMLEALLRSAGSYGEVRRVAEGLAARFDEADASYVSWQETWPAWRPIGDAWRARLAASRGLLDVALLHSEAETQPIPVGSGNHRMNGIEQDLETEGKGHGDDDQR